MLRVFALSGRRIGLIRNFVNKTEFPLSASNSKDVIYIGAVVSVNADQAEL